MWSVTWGMSLVVGTSLCRMEISSIFQSEAGWREAWIHPLRCWGKSQSFNERDDFLFHSFISLCVYVCMYTHTHPIIIIHRFPLRVLFSYFSHYHPFSAGNALCLSDPKGLVGKDSACSAGDTGHGFNPWIGKITWRRKWQPIPVFLPEKSHGQRSLVGYSPKCGKELDATERWRTQQRQPTT